jgi:cation transport ATPase
MDRSTPVSHLQRNSEQDPSAAEMMENIVHDLDHEGEMHQHPQQQREPTAEEIEFMQHQMMQQQQQQQQQQQRMMQHKAPEGHHGPMVPPRMQTSLEHQSVTQKIMSEAKEPLLVSVIVMLMSSGQLQSLMNKFLPISASNPLIGLAIRAIIAGALFYVLRRFIPV